MAVAYLTGINESIIKKNLCTPQQKEVVRQALGIFKRYEDNFRVVRVPSPSISLVKQLVREQVSLHDIRYVFYDYIFISPSLLGEFRGMALRNDEILLMFSDALKQLAVELDVFIMSSTQVNANADNSNDIRNEASIAGSRAVINKADVGCIMARPTKEELKTLEPITDQLGVLPNVVTDIYKLRGGENTQTRVWSVMDLGTLRKTDLFVTDARLDQVDIGYEKVNYEMAEDLMIETAQLLAELNKRGVK
jgi:replicative DNA helicase